MNPVSPSGGGKTAVPAPRATGLRGAVLPTVVAMVVAQLVVGLAWRDQQDSRDLRLQEQLSREANAISIKVRDRIVTYGLVLRGAGALFSTEERVTRGGWRNYVERLSLYRDYPGFQGLGYSRILAAADVAGHEQAMRAEGLADYRVWPEGRREVMTAITYLEPDNWRNRRALGFDMYSEPVRQEAMARARASGDLALSGKVVLVQEAEADMQAGVLLYLPLHGVAGRGGAPFLGWVFSPFRMNDLMGPVLAELPGEVRLSIYDGDGLEAAALLFDSHPARDGGVAPAPALAYDNPLLVQGRRWTLRFEALPGYGANLPNFSPGLVLLAALALLMVAGTWMLFSSRQQARRLIRLSESLRLREEQYATLVNLSREGICAVDQEMRFTFVNPRLAEWLGRPAEELVGRRCHDFCASGGVPDRRDILARLQTGRGQTYEMRLGGLGSGERVLLVSDHPLRDEAGRLLGATMVLTDVTERQLAAERIHFLATHDVLTGVPNRLTVRERLGQALALARRYERKVGVLFIDLDFFKEVNDTYGHGVGDQVLVESVARIRECLRSSDTVGRLGGDEFMVLLPEIEMARDGQAVATKIVEVLERPMVVLDHEIRISASIGMVLFPDDGLDEETLVSKADAAMYRAKCGGRGRVVMGCGD